MLYISLISWMCFEVQFPLLLAKNALLQKAALLKTCHFRDVVTISAWLFICWQVMQLKTKATQKVAGKNGLLSSVPWLVLFLVILLEFELALKQDILFNLQKFRRCLNTRIKCSSRSKQKFVLLFISYDFADSIFAS